MGYQLGFGNHFAFGGTFLDGNLTNLNYGLLIPLKKSILVYVVKIHHSLSNKYLLNTYYISDTLLGARNISVN